MKKKRGKNNGYVLIRPDVPINGVSRRAYEHVLVMENNIGRKAKKYEV